MYERDEASVREKQEAVQDAQDEIAKAKIQDQIDLIQKEIDLLNDEKEALQDAMEAATEYYDNLIKEQEKYWDSLIDALEQQKSKWEELAEVETIAKAYASVKEVMEDLGYSVEDVLNDTPGAFEAFKNAYLNVLKDMNSGNQPFLEGLDYAVNSAKGAFGDISSSAGQVEDAMGQIADATAPLTDAASNITEVGTAAQNASSGVGELKNATDGIANNLNSINAEGIINALQNVIDKIEKIKDAVGGEGTGLIGALTSLNELSFTSIADSFNAFADSIKNVASALGVGGGSPENEDPSDPANSKAPSTSEGADEGSGGEGLVGAITAIQKATTDYIGTDPTEEGKKAVGAFVALKGSVDNVSTAIGVSEEGGEPEDGTLSAAITDLQEVTKNAILGGEEGSGAKEAFDQLCTSIEACVTAVQALLEEIKNLSEISLGLPAFTNGDYTGTAYTHYEGTAKLRGDWGVRQGGRTLVGELGQELLIRDGKFRTIGDNGPEFITTQPNDVIMNHLQTRELLSKRNIIVPKNKDGLASGTVLSPISSSAISVGVTPTMSGIRDVIQDQTKAIQVTLGKLVAKTTGTPSVTVNNPSFVVSGVTGEQVMRQIEGSFEGLMLNAYQKAMS